MPKKLEVTFMDTDHGTVLFDVPDAYGARFIQEGHEFYLTGPGFNVRQCEILIARIIESPPVLREVA